MKGFVYILTNNNSVLYTGVTSNIKEQVNQHRIKKHSRSFTSRYNITRLVYYEQLDTIGEAIRKEKQIKGGSRKKKMELITALNPEWNDLYELLDG